MAELSVSPAVTEKQKVDIFALIGPGLEVYDNQSKKVGKVDTFFPGASGREPKETTVLPAPVAVTGQQTVPLMEPLVPVTNTVTVPELDTALHPGDDLPNELRERLRHDGFVRIDAGFLRHHRYALRNQIARVENDRIVLNISENELFRH